MTTRLELESAQAEAFACQVARKFADKKLPPIVLIELFVTEDCTLRCDYCFVNDKDKSTRMTWEVAKKAIDFLVTSSGDERELHINFFGGEPLMEFPLIKQVAEYTRDLTAQIGKTVHYAITTNGTIMNEEIAWFGREYEFNFMLSIDGDRYAHDLHRVYAGGRRGSWDAVMDNALPILKNIQKWVGARVTVSPDTARFLSSGVKTLFDRGVNQFLIGSDTDVLWTREEMNIFASEMHKVVDFYIEAKAEGLPIRIAEFEDTPEQRRAKNSQIWSCDAGKSRISVSASGDLYACSKFVRPFPGMESCKLGTLDDGFTDVRMRMQFIDSGRDKHPACSDCDACCTCAGGCPATNLHFTGSIYNPTAFQCFVNKLNMDLLTRIHSSEFC
ncbi:MAG: radical SAM protein [Armatimonadota bacterium]|nr:SPASM domain-containing protein [bacterium]